MKEYNVSRMASTIETTPTNALKYANVALGIDPYDPDAHGLLATFFEKAGETSKAAQEKQVAALLRERRDRAATP